MARTLIISAGLPENLWEAAVNHTIWIHNQVKSVNHKDSSPHQLLDFLNENDCMASHETIYSLLVTAAMDVNTQDTPKHINEALSPNNPEAQDWTCRILNKFKGLQKHNMFRKPNRDERRALEHNGAKHKIFQNHCIFKQKTNGTGKICRYKA